MSEHFKPEKQTVSKCSELRENMQGKIFERMQNLHDDQMTAIGGIKEEIAFRKGREEALVESALTKFQAKNNGNNPTQSNGTKDVLVKILINWGPWILLLLLLGIISIFRSKGWL